MEVNSIYEGDNLEIMSKFPNKSVDLIYADPPFFSNQQYEVIWDDGAEKRSFEDRWKGGIEHYTSWMEPRLRECQRVLKDTGSMYLHCDYHANAHLRILMDKIFGENNFKSEIIWQRTGAHNDPSKFGMIHDTILFYSKTKNYTFNPIRLELTQEHIDTRFNQIDKKTGKRFFAGPITAPGSGPPRMFKGQLIKPPSRRHWSYTQDKIDELEKKDMIYYSATGTPYLKQFMEQYIKKGRRLQSIWTDLLPSKTGKEIEGYPTQKPVKLLERIIEASSQKGDIVLDPFCGCGTALVAAQKLGRKWVGIDVSPTACKLMQKRLRKEFSINAHVIRGEVDLNYVKKLVPFEFQNWVVTDKFLGKVSDRKVGDMGIDGFTPQVTGGYPIQVKQSEGVGRNVVDNFETAIRRIGKTKGYIVAYSFGRGAVEEADRAKNHEGLEIILRTVQELLEGKAE